MNKITLIGLELAMPRMMVKTVKQQALLSIHRVRDGLVNSRSATCNQIKGWAWDAHTIVTGLVLLARRLLPEAAVGFAAWMSGERGGSMLLN